MAAKKKSLPLPLIIGGVVLVIAIGAGAYFMLGKGGDLKNSITSGSNAFTSIKDALSKSLSLQCEFKDTQGRVSKVSIKNGAMRGDFTGATTEESGSVIMRDNKMYFWNDKEGFVMEVPKEEAGGNGEDYTTSSGNGSSQGQDFLKEIEEYKDSCKPAVVSDSVFTPPADVNFSDMSKMMQTVPEGSGMTEEDLQEMMQQYGDQ